VSIGDQIILTEAVQVVDEHGLDLLLAGTEGSVVRIEGKMFALATAKGVYEDIPISGARLIEDEKAA
jgi:hypothetical protein